ncbi:MAG: electron transfer flavoprotein subunit beta/FixA family protein [Thaumarchaeota archaeon]|nr:electron transfer flavoprotein subunit beta/FixA family protein [Nitrososphaerota archaeon]
MKLAVCVKHAVDETELKVDSSGRPLIEGAAYKMSTFDKNAVEEALRIRSSVGGEVTILTVGPPEARKTVKEALAMGADKGVLIIPGTATGDSLRTAGRLADAIRKDGPYDFVICSEGSSDTYTGQVPPMLAELLGVPYVGYARKVEAKDGGVVAERALEDSVETVEARTPLVIAVVSEINEPRYPTLIQIMQAAKKPIEERRPDEAGSAESRSAPTVVSMSAQQAARKHLIIEGSPGDAARKLLDALRKEGVL